MLLSCHVTISESLHNKMKFCIKDFFSKCDQIRTCEFTEEIFNGNLHFCAVISFTLYSCLNDKELLAWNRSETDANVKELLAWNRRCHFFHNFVVSNLTKRTLFRFYGQLPVYIWNNFVFTKSTEHKVSFGQRDLGIIYFYLVIMY